MSCGVDELDTTVEIEPVLVEILKMGKRQSKVEKDGLSEQKRLTLSWTTNFRRSKSTGELPYVAGSK